MSRTKVAVTLLLLGANAIAFGAPWPNSKCLPKGTWQCIEQGARICNTQRTNCSGDCYVCIGNTTVPAKMCFVQEGSECEPLAPYICGAKLPDGHCVKSGTDCFCETAVNQATIGQCEFTSCN